MRKLDIGTGRAHFEDYETLDVNPNLGTDHCEDIELASPKDFKEQFDVIRAHHVLEHIRPENRVRVMFLLYSWLKQGGILDIEVPIAGTPQFYQDPTHLSWWTPETFWYFTKGNKFGEAFAKRYSDFTPLMKKVSDKKDDWRYNIILKRV